MHRVINDTLESVNNLLNKILYLCVINITLYIIFIFTVNVSYTLLMIHGECYILYSFGITNAFEKFIQFFFGNLIIFR